MHPSQLNQLTAVGTKSCPLRLSEAPKSTFLNEKWPLNISFRLFSPAITVTVLSRACNSMECGNPIFLYSDQILLLHNLGPRNWWNLAKGSILEWSADVLSGRHLVSMTFCQDGRTALDVLSGPPWTFCQDGFMLDVLSGRHFVSSRMASLGRFVRTPSVLQLLGTNGYFRVLLGT